MTSLRVFDLCLHRMLGKTPDEARLDEALKTLDAKLDVYDLILGKQKYIAGNVSLRALTLCQSLDIKNRSANRKSPWSISSTSHTEARLRTRESTSWRVSQT